MIVSIGLNCKVQVPALIFMRTSKKTRSEGMAERMLAILLLIYGNTMSLTM